METEFEETFARLGLAQYLPYFQQAGCSDWHFLCNFTEFDFASIGVKRGHRRKLQREAARRHQWPNSRPLPSAGDICHAHSPPVSILAQSWLKQRQAAASASATTFYALEPTKISPDSAASDHYSCQSNKTSSSISRNAGQASPLRFASESGHEKEGLLGHVDRWTEVTSSEEFMDHLLMLYFRWEYPLFATISKTHFLSDFRTGTPRYCSALLVNSLLAIGCGFSDQLAARSDLNNVETSGDHFFAEAKLLLTDIKDRSLTTIQALGLMAIREASCDRESESLFYSGQSIRMAVEMGLHVNSDSFFGIEQNVRNVTFWGAFCLDQAWSLVTGCLPHVSCVVTPSGSPVLVGNSGDCELFCYANNGFVSKKTSPIQSCDIQSIYGSFCALSKIVHQSLYILHIPGRSVSKNDVLSIYTQYLEWYDSLPAELRLGANPSPAGLFLHIYYHYATLLLLQPFINHKIFAATITPFDACIQAAKNISSLMRAYSQLYGLRHIQAFIPRILLASTITHFMAIGSSQPSPDSWTQAMQGMSDLQDMSVHYPFAKRAIDILNILARYWGIDVFASNKLGEKEYYSDHIEHIEVSF